MKIGFQGLFLNKPHTGIGQYSINLLAALSEVDKKNEYLIVTPEAPALALGKNFHVKVVPFLPNMPSASLKKLWWEQLQVPKIFTAEKVDLAFYPYPANPWVKQKIASIVAVHDTIPWDRREYAPTLLSRLKHYQSKKALPKASSIICVSETTKTDLLRHLPSLQNKQISVVHNGISPIFKEKLPRTKIEEILSRYGLNEQKYFLYVGGYDERKNVQSVLKAFLKYIAPHHPVKMVFVGDKAHLSKLYASLDYLKDLVENEELKKMPGQIVLTGFVTEEELSALYSETLALVNTSLQEGFNLPIVEAASSHTPVICSDIPVHHEVLADYPANFVSTIDEIGRIMLKFIADESFHKAIAKQCKGCKLEYAWANTARQLLKVYELVFADHRHN